MSIDVSAATVFLDRLSETDVPAGNQSTPYDLIDFMTPMRSGAPLRHRAELSLPRAYQTHD